MVDHCIENRTKPITHEPHSLTVSCEQGKNYPLPATYKCITHKTTLSLVFADSLGTRLDHSWNVNTGSSNQCLKWRFHNTNAAIPHAAIVSSW